MARKWHVNGLASIASGTDTGGGLEELGISVDGVTLKPNWFHDPVNTDAYGSRCPFDYLYLGQEITITCDLIHWDKAVLAKWLSGQPGQQGTEGKLAPIGDIMAINGLAARLLIRSTPANQGLIIPGTSSTEDCHNFPLAFLIDQAEGNFGTKRTVWRLTWKAITSQISPSSSTGQPGVAVETPVIYNNECD